MIRDWKRYCKLLRPRIVRKYVSKKYWRGICQFIHYVHSKWDLVGYSGGSPGLENAVKSWGRRLGPFVFLFTSIQARVFHLLVNSRACPLKRNASPWKTLEQAREIPLWSRAILGHGGTHCASLGGQQDYYKKSYSKRSIS